MQWGEEGLCCAQKRGDKGGALERRCKYGKSRNSVREASNRSASK